MAKKKKKYEEMSLDELFGEMGYEDYDARAERWNARRKAATERRKERDQWVDLSTFKDGYDFGDVTKSILGTGTKVQQKFTKGVQSNLEGFLDTGTNWLSMGTEALGWDKATKGLRKFAQKDFLEDADLVNKTLRVANPVLNLYAMGASAKENLSDGFDATDIGKTILQGSMPGSYLEDAFTGEKSAGSKAIDKLADYSVTGNKLDELTQTVGQITGQAALTGVGVPWQLTAFANSAGNEMNNAFQNNATAGQAFLSGLISGAVEVGTEYIGSGANKLFGMESLGSKALGKLGSKISNKAIQYITKMGFDGASEGLEEVLSGLGTAIGQKLTYMNDKDFDELYSSDQALDDFVMGALGSVVTNVPNSVRSVSRGENAFTGLTENEKTVLDKEIERRTNDLQKNGKELTKGQKKQIEESVQRDLQKGYISADFIEETLGKDFDRSKDSYLQESFRERIRSNFRANIDTSNVKNEFEKATLESANRFLDGTNKARETAEIIAKLSKDTNTAIEFTNNNSEEIQNELAKIKDKAINKLTSKGMSLEEAKAKVDNRFKNATLNGMKISGENGNKILINADSPNMLAAITGHEITHLLENTNEYKKLRKLAYDYAKMQGDERSADVEDYGLYEEISDGDSEYLNQELTADLVGDYIVNNEDFIRNLYAKDRNVFQKIKDFIDDLVTRFTGTDEERKLRECQRSFERAIREFNKGQKNIDLETTQQEKVTKTSDLNEYVADAAVRQAQKTKIDKESVKQAIQEHLEEEGITNPTKEDMLNAFDTYELMDASDEFNDYKEAEKFISDVADEMLSEQIAPVKETPKEFAEVTDEDLFNINMEEVENQFDKQEYKLNEDVDSEDSPFGNYWDLDDMSFNLKDGKTLWLSTPREYGKYKNGKTDYHKEIYNKIDFTIYGSNDTSADNIIDEYSIENEKGEFTRDDILNAIKHMTYDDSNKVADGQLDIFDNVHRNDGHRYSLSDNPKIFNEVKKYDSMEDFIFDSNISYDELESAGLGGLGEIVEYYNNKNKPILKDYKNTKESASFTEDRLDSVISESISDYDDNYARAYITHMSPEQFLGLTASEQTMERLNQETEELDVEKLAKERQHIFLDVNLETGKVTGHEGRHRMLALQRAGIKDVEMVIYPDSGTYDRSNAPRIDSMNLIGQDFRMGKGTDTTIGEMIPVSKATQNELRSQNREDSGVRYSLTDNQGRELSKEQQEYFKDSKVVDDEGRLLEVYHGTDYDFTVFRNPNRQYNEYDSGKLFADTSISMFTDSQEVAQTYVDNEENPNRKPMSVYLNMTNPYIVDADYQSNKYFFDNDGKPTNVNTLVKRIYDSGEYDGVIIKNVADVGNYYDYDLTDGRQYATDYIVFDSNQIKNVDNKAPTSNPDIRYSLSVAEANTGKDNEGRTLSKGMQDYMAESKATDENGNLVTVYHTMTDWGKQFNEFNPIGSENYRYGNQVVNFYTDSQDMSGSYADQDYRKADTRKLNSLEEANKYLENSTLRIVDLENTNPAIKNHFKDTNERYLLVTSSLDVFGKYNTEDELLRNVIPESQYAMRNNGRYQYEGYLNMKNPKVIDAKGKLWNRIEVENLQELKNEISNKWDVPERQLDRLEGDTLKELNKDLTQIGFQLMPDQYGDLGLFTKNGQLAVDLVNVNDVMQEIRTDLASNLNTPISTNDIVFQTLAENELGSDYDGIIIENVVDNGGATLNSGEANTVYITFAPNQFKSFDNQNPTSDNDIRYSLTPSGEMQDSNGNKVTLETSDTGTTGTLMAIHNLSEQKFKGILELGGFPVPSIAVTKPESINHQGFGDISVLFDKSTIDPSNSANEVYDRDVWTPTFPQVNYDINNEDLRKMAKENNFYDNSEDGIASHARLNYLYADNLASEVNGYGIDNVLNRMKKDNELKYLYAKTIDKNYQPKMKPTKYSYDYSNETLQRYVDMYNQNPFNGMSLPDFYYHYLNYGDMNLTEDQQKALKATVRDMILPEVQDEARLEYEKAKHRDNFKIAPISEEKFVEQYTNMMLKNFDESYFKYKDFIKDASRLDEFGETQVIDEARTLIDVEGNINQEEYEKWVDDTFGNMLRNTKRGIRNDKDLFTPMGNRRSFDSLHDEYNLQNLVKILTSKNTVAGEEGFGSGEGFGTIQAKMSERFNSIEDIKNAEDRLQYNDETKTFLDEMGDKFSDYMSELNEYSKYEDNYYYNNYGGIAINDFAGYKNKTLQNLNKALENNGIDSSKVPTELKQNIIDDVNSLKEIPTDYFEAKPQRAVGLDEIQQVVIPSDLDAEFKQQLQDMGIKYSEYDRNIEGDRQRVINQFDDLKFSLSGQNDIAPIGGWNVRGSDIAFDENKIKNALTPVLAPIKESVDQLNQSLQELKQQNNLDDITLDITPFLDMINGTEETNQLSPQNLEKAKETLVQQGVPVDAAQNFVQNMVNRFDTQFNKIKEKFTEKDLKKWQKMIATAQEAFTNRNAIIDKLAKDSGNQMIKYRGDLANNSFGQAQYNVETAQTDLNGNEIGKSINGLFEQAEKQGLGAVLDDYLFHKSNIERHAVGKGSQVPANVSEQLVRDYEKSYPQLKEWAKGFETYFDNLLQLEVDSGLIDQDSRNLLRGEEGIYRSYVPFYENEAEKRYFDDAGDLKPIKPLKRAKGGVNQSKLMGMKQAMTKQTMAVWNSMRTNQLYQEIINTLGGEEGLGFIVRNDPSNLSQSLYTDQDGNKFLTAYVNGQEMSTKISDELYNELSKKSENAIKDLEDKYSILTKPLQGISNFRRNILTSYNPTFALFKNPVKDIQDAVLYSKHTAGMLANLPSAYGELLTNKTKEAKQFRALYGGGEYTGFGKGYARVSEMIELAPRYAEYKASLKAGESVEQAIYNAREVTTNFGRGGYITKAMNRNGFTFLNASVQGFSKFYRNFAEQPNAGQFAMAVGKAAMLGVLPAIFNDLAFGSGDDKDEDYEALPNYIKDNYYLFKTGDGEFIRIPKGRALSVFGSAARRTLDLANGDENAFDGYLSNAWSQIGPVEIAANPLDNTIVAPIAQVLGGEKGSGGNTAGRAWYGGDIVPYRLQGERPEDQSDASVDKMSIWLGEKLGISPYKINYVIDQYTGGLGDLVLPMLTEETKNGAESPLEYAIAPVRDQVVVNSIDDNKYVSEFYSTKEKLYTGSKATDKELLKAQYMNDVSFDLSSLYKEKRAVQSDSSLGKKEKYAKVQEIQKQINDIAKAGLELSDKITVQGSFADVGEDRGYYKNTKGKWTAISQDDMVTIESLGLTDSEKSAYFDVKNQIYNLDNDYRAKKEGKSESEQIQLGIQQKKDRIETIKSSTLPDSAKYAAFDIKYDDKLLPYYEDLGFNANDYLSYKQQVFTADKDKNGKTIANSKKKKVVDYINNSNMPYEQKLILYKREYKSDKSYDSTIFNYINNSNLDYTSKTKILDELGIKYR